MRLLPDKQKALQSAEQTRQEAATRLEAVQSEQSDLTRIIKKVRELDLLRAGKQTRRDEMAAAVEIMTANCHSSQDAISKHQAELQETQNAREETGLYLQENHADASLAENLGAITRMFDALREGSALLTRLHGERVNALQIKQQCISTYVDADTAMKHKHSEMLAIQQQQEQLQQASAALLAGLEMGAWRRRLDDQRQRQHQLESALQAYNNITALLARGDELSAQAKSLSLEEQRLAAEIKTHTDKKDRREQEVQYLEIQAALLNRIHSLEEERARLEDGMPCPLCGATDHPYARGNIPALDQTEISLQNIRTELKTIDRHLSRLHIRQAETAKDLQQTRLAVKQTGEALQSEQKLCADILAVLALDCSRPSVGFIG
jgi:exonuclease SbcC